MSLLRQYSVLLWGILYAVLCGWFIWSDQAFLVLLSIGLLLVYFALFHSRMALISLAFLTPLSVNIEEYTESFGLFIPTEPLLFILMVTLLLQQLRSNIAPGYVWKHPIVLAIAFLVLWIVITTISSTHILVSVKFLLAKLWYFIPLLIFAPAVFEKRTNIRTFLWLFVLSMSVVISYTLFVHASYGFGEQEGHWVMWPFFKDHTIYGSAVAFVTPLIFGIYFSKKHQPLVHLVLLFLIAIILLGLYFSYTRAAWLSVLAALLVLFMIRWKVPFRYLLVLGLSFSAYIFFSWDSIQMEMARNKSEHTTEEFGERLQSATNVTTDASNLERLNRWSCAIEMFKEKPVFGFGPGTYAFEYARFQEPENLTIISTNFGDMGNAHSEYLGPLAEMGLVGLIAMIVLVSCIFYSSIRLYQRWPQSDSEMRTLMLAMILALVTYFVHGMLNNFLDTDKAAVPVWTICAIFIAQEAMLKSNALSKE